MFAMFSLSLKVGMMTNFSKMLEDFTKCKIH